jgi:nitrite reductase (NADH) small subunit
MAEEALVSLGRVSRIPDGQGRCYVVGPHEIAIFRQRDGRLFASQNRCPHRGGPLAEGLLGGGRIVCPLHAHQFDLTTGAGQEPTECLRVFAVTEVDGDIFVSMNGGPS